jgi:hypothetical protein
MEERVKRVTLDELASRLLPTWLLDAVEQADVEPTNQAPLRLADIEGLAVRFEASCYLETEDAAAYEIAGPRRYRLSKRRHERKRKPLAASCQQNFVHRQELRELTHTMRDLIGHLDTLAQTP